LLWLLPATVAARAVEIVYAEELYPPLATLLQQSMDAPNALAVRALEVEIHEQEARRVRGENLPHVRLQGRVIANYQIREDIPDRLRGSINANLTITQNLYHWGAFRKREEIANSRAELERERFSSSAAQHIMQLRQAYLRWQLLLQQQQVLARTLELSGQFVDAHRRMADSGDAAQQEVLEMEARLLESMEALAAVERQQEAVRSWLAQLTGGIADVSLLAPQSLDRIEPLDDDAFERLRRLVAPEAALAAKEADYWQRLAAIEADQYAVLERRNWPSLQLVAGAFSDQLDSINQSDPVLRVQYFGGVQVNWNIFDGWQTEAMKRATLARRRSMELQARMASMRADNEAAELLGAINLHRKQLRARTLRADLLKRRLDLLRMQFERDQASASDVLQGEIDLLDVSQRVMHAQVEYLGRLMELGALIGDDPALDLTHTLP
jgi:outer membrane protein TolC